MHLLLLLLHLLVPCYKCIPLLFVEYEDHGGLAASICGDPPEHVLFDHLEESFRVDRTRVHFSLETTHLSAPWHRLTLQTVRTELHQGLVQRIKHCFVLYVHRFLKDWILVVFLNLIIFVSSYIFFSDSFDFQVQINRQYRVLIVINSSLKVFISPNFRRLQQTEHLQLALLDGVSQHTQELPVVVLAQVRWTGWGWEGARMEGLEGLGGWRGWEGKQLRLEKTAYYLVYVQLYSL
jgi:hypothetical protein